MDTKKFEDFVIGKLGYETTIVPTQRDIDIVRYSWEKVMDLRLSEDEESVSPAQAFGLAFYDALFELDPSVRSLFGTNVFTQAKMLSGVLAFITRVPFIKQQPNNNNSNNNSNNDIYNKNDFNHDSNNNYNSSDDDSILNEKPPSITKTYTIREINAMKREQEEKENKDNYLNHHHHQNYNINNHHHPCQYLEKESNNIVNSHHPKNKVHNNGSNKKHHQHNNNNYSNNNPPISHSRSSSSRSISSKLKNNNNKCNSNKGDLDVDPDLLIEKLQDLGARHFYYNVKPEQFKLIGPAIDAALKKRLGDEYTKEVKDAWSITHAYAAHHMAVGLRSQQQYEKKKSNSLRNSSNNNCNIQ